METLELLVALLAAVAVVVRLAGRTLIPEPVLLVLAGLAVAVIPGLPSWGCRGRWRWCWGRWPAGC
ncbi:MAG TPA: hypothetical protein VHA34_02095 [Actinomycetes bacterium]|nr:hypothetical protein [Actinomycetes bacterium]HEV3503716.1 hypothetical protein [Actinomycetes bacterium]